MYSFNKDIENFETQSSNSIGIQVYPKYILSNRKIYYDKATNHNECMINIFIMNVINGILRTGWIENIEKYLVDLDFNDNGIFLSLEKQIYSSIHHYLMLSNNPRKAFISLLKLLNYQVKESKEFDKEGNRIHFQINDYTKLTDLMIELFLFDQIHSINGKYITTSKSNIYETFFNYMIMDYIVDKTPKIVFTGDDFERDWSMTKYTSDKEENLKREIELIKKYPIKDRYEFLR